MESGVLLMRDRMSELLGSSRGIDQVILAQLATDLDKANRHNTVKGEDVAVARSLEEWHRSLPFLSKLMLWWHLHGLEKQRVIFTRRVSDRTYYWLDRERYHFYQQHSQPQYPTPRLGGSNNAGY